MTRHGSRLDITVAHDDRRIVLACDDRGTSLDCAVTSPGEASRTCRRM